MKKIILLFLFIFLFQTVTGCKKEVIPNDDKLENDITEFIEEYGDYYLSTENASADVIVAIQKLKQVGFNTLNKDVTTEFIDNYVNKTYNDINDAYKGAHILKAYNKTSTNLIDYVKTIDETYYNPWNLTQCYYLIKTFDSEKTEKLTYLENKMLEINESDYRDADYAASVLIALQDKNVDKAILYNDLINPNVTSTGVTSFGNINSCSTSMVIRGLISQNIDPTSYKLDENTTIDLVNALNGFKLDNGYKWLLTDEKIDLVFSTPQAFAALVDYYIYKSNQTN